jgi:hypothetical protein
MVAMPGMLLIDGMPGPGVDGMGWWWLPGVLLIDGMPGPGVDGMGWWWPPGVLLIDGIMVAGVDGMGWWPGGGLFEVVKLKAARTTVSPAAAHAAATVRRRKGRRVGSVIENLLPAIMRGGRRCAVRWLGTKATGRLGSSGGDGRGLRAGR